MKFDLRINPDWKVIDAATGLPVTHVRWVDDESHKVAWCECARDIDRGGNTQADLALLFGATGASMAKSCEDNEFIKAMPKVKIDTGRKIVLVNVNEQTAKDDAYIEPAEPHRFEQARKKHDLPAIIFVERIPAEARKGRFSHTRSF